MHDEGEVGVNEEGVDVDVGEEGGVMDKVSGARVGRIALPSYRRRKKGHSELDPQWKRRID